MKGEILLGHIRGCRDKPGGETEHADERLLGGGQGSENTHSEHLLSIYYMPGANLGTHKVLLHRIEKTPGAKF